MTSVVSETIRVITEKCPLALDEIRIDDVVLGIFFTGVKLSTGHSGVAFTPIGEVPEAVCCPTSAARMPPAGKFEGTPVAQILQYATNPNVLKSAIGIAILNALSQSVLESEQTMKYRMVTDVDGFDLLGIQPRETVTLIGAFTPYIRRLKMMGNPFFILEKNPQTLKPDEMPHYRPESEIAPTFEKTDVAIITGTAIVNHTIDGILSHLRKRHRAGVIGPTASMLPDAFFERGIDVTAGIRVVEPDAMIKILKQAGSGYHLLQECSQKTAFLKPSLGAS
jgi:uncharacterized protein (DUF4213/DUF364 family)